MSRCYLSDTACPGCGLKYKRFRTGFTYQDIYQMLCSPDHDTSTWKYKRRNTVLGLWHQTKKQLWERHTTVECSEIVPF